MSFVLLNPIIHQSSTAIYFCTAGSCLFVSTRQMLLYQCLMRLNPLHALIKKDSCFQCKSDKESPTLHRHSKGFKKRLHYFLMSLLVGNSNVIFHLLSNTSSTSVLLCVCLLILKTTCWNKYEVKWKEITYF